MSLLLEYRSPGSIPLEVEGITPDVLREKSFGETEQMPVFEGNRQGVLADFFKLSGDLADGRMVWEGDLSGVHWLGAHMREGEMLIRGPAGRHIGSEMRGGRIIVQGDASDWVGGEMRGGSIHIQGNAGHLIGAAYRGSPVGMRGGVIMIDGNAGNELGHTMRRGLLAVGGDVGDLIGFNMLAGSIFVFGASGIRHGAGMRRGTLGFFGPPPPLLATFRRACRYRPVMLTMLFRQLRKDGFHIADELLTQDFELHHGDMIEGGRGEILLRGAA